MADMEEDRWLARLAHRSVRQLPLIEAPVPPPRTDIAARICAAWARTDSVPPPSLEAYQQDFVAALDRGDAEAVADELAGLGRARIGQGFLGGALQHDRARDRLFAERLARWTCDKLLSLAEAVGAIRLENPENGPWGMTPQAPPADLFRAIAETLDADLIPPAHIGGYLGIAAGDGVVLHMRMLDAIHAAWRLRQLADTLGLGAEARIAEIGAGSGLVAFYAARLGLRNYRLYDRPAMCAVQAHVLMGEGLDLSLPGEQAKDMAILDIRDLGAAKPGSIDLLLNIDSLPGLDLAEAIAHIAEARRLGIGHLLSTNHEARRPDQTPVSELVHLAGGYRLASRHRHWLRVGYVEEHYILAGQPQPPLR